MMKEKNSRSLHAFVEQTAAMLRSAATGSKKKKKPRYAKETSLSTTNKIERIAHLLRSTAKLFSKKKH